MNVLQSPSAFAIEPRPKQKHRQPEFELVCALRGLLDRAGNRKVFWSAIENGERRPKEARERCARKGVRNGLPDLFFIASGLPIGVELKAAANKALGIKAGVQSDAQKAVQEAWEAAGGLYQCVWGWDEAVAFFQRWGLIKGVS